MTTSTRKMAMEAMRMIKILNQKAKMETIKKQVFFALLSKEKIREIRLKGGRKYRSVGIVDYCHGDVFAFTARNDGFDFKLADVVSIIP